MQHRLPYIIIACACAMLAGCNRQSQDTYQRQAISVHVTRLTTQSTVATRTYVGEIEEAAAIHITATIPGKVTELRIKNGDHVHAGQLLLTIDNTQAKSALASAEATLRKAEDALSRVKQVYEVGGVTEQKLVELTSQVDQARAMKAMAEKNLNDTRICAPQDGIINDCNIHIGQNILPGVTLMTLYDMTGYNVSFFVPESEYPHIQCGDMGCMSVAAIEKENIPIRVQEKSLHADRIAHSYRIKAYVLDKKDIAPGMAAKVQLAANQVQGFIIPQQCISIMPEGTAIWLAKDSIAERRSIRVGQYVQGGVVVSDGLNEGDLIITDGFQKLYNGAIIRY